MGRGEREPGAGGEPGRGSEASPVRLVLITAAAIVVAEAGVMVLLQNLGELPAWLRVVMDSLLLVTVLAPVLHVFVFRPLAKSHAARGRAQAALRETLGTLEKHVQERTLELETVNTDLKTEVAERVRIEEGLREAETRYRTLFAQSPDGILIVDPETALPIEFNERSHLQLGYTREEFARLRVTEYEAAEEPEETRAHVEKVLREGRDTFETRHRTKGGETRDVRVIVQTISFGRRPAFHAIFRDITERRRTEAALRKANEKLTASLAELNNRNRQMDLLSQMDDLLQACSTEQEAHEAVSHFAQGLFAPDAGALHIYSPSRDDLHARAAWGTTDAGNPAETLAAEECWALRRGRVHAMETPEDGFRCAHLARRSLAGYICVPMMAHGEVLGVLHVRRERASFLPEAGPIPADHPLDRQLVQTVADHVALALANLRLRDTLRQQSIRDPLTGLYNRRYLEETLEREVHRAIRNRRPLALLTLDLDHFKQFNDAFGHEAGDILLRELGAFLKGRVRGGDIACRHGGEEFMLVLAEASLEDACVRAEEIRTGAKQLSVVHRGQVLGGITLSLGVSVLPEHGSTVSELTRSADLALYAAKEAGRDRTVVAAPPEV